MTRKLRHKVYFVNQDASRFPELCNGELPENLSSTFEKCAGADDIWTIQTYIYLKKMGLDVELSTKLVEGAICVIGYNHLKVKAMPFRSYVLACRFDGPAAEICDHQTVLNRLNIEKSTDHFMPHWPQPMIKPRPAGRGSLIERLDFKGAIFNLHYSFRDESFIEELKNLGVTFTSGSLDVENRSVDQVKTWADYTQSDLILAARNMTEYDATLKPAIKLINAWHAGVPALLGPEPAYQELRKSDLDYIEVKTPDDVLNAIKELKSNPEKYEAMIENGYSRANEFSTEKVAQCWLELLNGPISEGYENWKTSETFLGKILRMFRFFNKVIQHKLAWMEYKRRVNAGRRILE